MFTLTEAETAALARNAEIEEAIRQKTIEARSLGYNPAPDARERIQTELAVLKAEEAALATDETTLTAALKVEANKAVAEKIPGGSYFAILGMAEQTLALLDTDGGERTTNLVKQVLIRLANAGADVEWNDARARITAQRYQSLITAGLPVDLVGQIIVAEASKPWPTFGASSSKK